MKTRYSRVTPVVDDPSVDTRMLRFLTARINERVRKLNEEEVELRRQQPEIQMRIGTVVGVVKPRKKRARTMKRERGAEEREPSWFD